MIGVEYSLKSSLIRSVAVQPHKQQAGLGRQRLTAVIEDAREHRFENIYTLSSTSGDYFIQLGFVRIEIDKLRNQLPQVPQVIQFEKEGWSPARQAFYLGLATI